MKMKLAIRELHRSERSLAGALLRMSDRHRVDHEIYHVARDVARWSQEHVRKLAEAGKQHGLRLSPTPVQESERLSAIQQKFSELLGGRPEPSLILLADLRRLHRKAAGVSLDWELLAQGAQAVQAWDLLTLAQHCHPQTLRQLKWTNTMLKSMSPQILAAA